MGNFEPEVHVFTTREEMGEAAARAVRERILHVLQVKPHVRMVFAAAPSQLEMLAALTRLVDIPWQRVVGFHMDEYFGLPWNAPQSFARFLRTNLFDRVPFGRVACLDVSTHAPVDECRRYARLLAEEPLDIVCMGIGENGHIAFNDPSVADFSDPLLVKVAELDDRCRQQQVNDGCFPTLDDVPRQAITLTIPALLSAPYVVAVVPGPQKAQAVRDALRGPLSTACPASALRTHPHVELFLDRHSSALLG